MASEEDCTSVQVLYQLSWEGKLEHPHMITVQYPSDQDGLRLRDVKKRLTALRGQGISHSFSWSSKRNYKSTFIWNDLSEDDLIHPLRGSQEYVLKVSELIDAFTRDKAGEKRVEPQNERVQQSSLISNQDVDRHSRAMPVDGPAVGAGTMDDSTKGVATDSHQNQPPLSVEQETIDVEKSDFCLSSSDNEISPRPNTKNPDSKSSKDLALVVVAKSPMMQGLQTPLSNPRATSPPEAPFSPGSAKRMWRREIRKALFRTRNTNASPLSQKHETASPENTTEPAQLETSRADASPWKDARSSSVGNETKHTETEPSTSQLIRLIWNRWTGGGGSTGKRTSPAASPSPRPCEEAKPNPSPDTHQSPTQPCTETSSPTQVDTKEIPKPARSPAPPEAGLHTPETPADQAQKQETQHFLAPDLQIELESPATGRQCASPVTEVKTPKPAIARAEFHSVKSCKGLPRVKTSVSPKSLPAGVHKGTNDTKPVQTPRRSSIPLASPPLRRSFSKPEREARIVNGAIARSIVDDFAPSPQSIAVHEIKKLISVCERDERPLIPGVTTLDWEKALQESAVDCLPPPNFGRILKKCSTCGRTFKPDSLQVHMRGCHPPEYARAFSLRASPHMRGSRAP